MSADKSSSYGELLIRVMGDGRLLQRNLNR
jgi:hypothetical protein